MEVQLAVKSTRSNGRATPPHHTVDTAKPVPNYLRPSTGSCHHACKYGGTHTFKEKDTNRAAQPKPWKQPDQQKRPLIRVRLVPRNLFGDRIGRGNEKVQKAAADDEGKKKGDESVEWKDIVPAAHHGSLPEVDDKQSARVMGSGDVKSKDVTRGKKSHDRSKISEQVDGVKNQNESLDKKPANKSVRSKTMTSSKVSTEPTHTNTDTTKTVRPPRAKTKPTVLLTKKKPDIDQELVDGYQPLSPSLLQNRASLLHDLQDEMVHESTTNTNEEPKPAHSLDHEDFSSAAETSSRPVVPAHRRAKSTSLSSRSVRFPFITRQSSSKTSPGGAFKLRSRSSKGPMIALPPDEEEKRPAARLARSRTRRGSLGGGEEIGGAGGRGIQLRIRSLRRRGVGGVGSGGGSGFVVPAVALRHQKTLEKKRSQRLYNNVIEETASRLVKTRKSRVKALVGAFESVISKIAK